MPSYIISYKEIVDSDIIKCIGYLVWVATAWSKNVFSILVWKFGHAEKIYNFV